MENKKFKKIEIYEHLHRLIGKKCWDSDVQMRILASRLLAKMFDDHKEEIEQIIKEIKMRKEN